MGERLIRFKFQIAAHANRSDFPSKKMLKYCYEQDLAESKSGSPFLKESFRTPEWCRLFKFLMENNLDYEAKIIDEIMYANRYYMFQLDVDEEVYAQFRLYD